jgi:hypothetical protein
LLLEIAPQADPVWTAEHLEAQAYYAIDPPNTPHPPIPEEDRRLTLEGQAGHSFAIPLLQSWDFELNRSLPTTGDASEGRYLRQFSAGIESFDYSASDGRAELLVDGFVSLSSFIEEGDLEVEFSADVGLLQWQDDEATERAATFEGTSEVLGRFDQVVSSP